MSETKTCLADALAYAAESSDCIAILIQARHWEDERPWCLNCPDAKGCWAWKAIGMLSGLEIMKAQRRRREWKRERMLGDYPASQIRRVRNGKQFSTQRKGG